MEAHEGRGWWRPHPSDISVDVDAVETVFFNRHQSVAFYPKSLTPLLLRLLRTQDYMKSKNWRVPLRNPHVSTEAQRSLAKLIIQTRSAFKDEFGCEP